MSCYLKKDYHYPRPKNSPEEKKIGKVFLWEFIEIKIHQKKRQLIYEHKTIVILREKSFIEGVFLREVLLYLREGRGTNEIIRLTGRSKSTIARIRGNKIQTIIIIEK